MDIPNLLVLFLKKFFQIGENWFPWALGLALAWALALALAPALALALGGPGGPWGDLGGPWGALGPGPGPWPWPCGLTSNLGN